MFSLPYYLTMPALAALALALDFLLGEPKRFHPLVGFGNIANKLEAKLNAAAKQFAPMQRAWGVCGWCLMVVPPTVLAYTLCQSAFSAIVNIALLYFAIGHKSLHQHAWAVESALQAGDFAQAQLAASYMVSRDSAAIEPVPATIESVLENGNDGVFGALFWFFVAGGTGALLYRLSNTLDAMWGYKTPRFYYFGWAAARLDDALNYIPARLCALSYALLGNTRSALHCWRMQAPTWDSPNAGPVMSAGAGALNVLLGGAARYQGEWHMRPPLGAGNAPTQQDIRRALKLVRHSVYVWLVVYALLVSAYCYA